MSALQAPDLQAAGERIETLLDVLKGGTDPRTYERVEEVLRLVTDLYGAGLGRVVELAAQHAPDMAAALVGDELVAGLLIVHDLHPDSLRARVESALVSVRPLLGHHGGDVELIDVDAEVGGVFLRLLGSCDGCPSSSATLQHAVEKAILVAAPEVTVIDVEPSQAAAVPITLGPRPAFDSCPSELATT
ncbi:MAG: hypothetical protein NVS3B12_15260 [Acidimicrobiales bacterium]